MSQENNMKWYLSIFTTILSFSILVMGVNADFELSDWRYYRVINLPLEITSGSLVEIPLDANVSRGPGDIVFTLIPSSPYS